MATWVKITTKYAGTRGGTGAQDRPNQATTVELWRDTDGDDDHAAIKSLSDSLVDSAHPVWTDLKCVLPVVEALGNSVYRVTMFYSQDDASVPVGRLPAPDAVGQFYEETKWIPVDVADTYSNGYTAATDDNGNVLRFEAELLVVRCRAFLSSTGTLNYSTTFAQMGKLNDNTVLGISTDDVVMYGGPAFSSYKITSTLRYNKLWHPYYIKQWKTKILKDNSVNPFADFILKADGTVDVTKPDKADLPQAPA